MFSRHRKALSLTTVFAVVSLLTVGALAISGAAGRPGGTAATQVAFAASASATATDHPCLAR